MPTTVDRQGNLLIVDDDEEVRALRRRNLEGFACECELAGTALAAREMLRKQSFSVVISDIRMPEMSGVELLSFIRNHDPDISVIMVSGVRDIATALEALRTGACDYITERRLNAKHCSIAPPRRGWCGQQRRPGGRHSRALNHAGRALNMGSTRRCPALAYLLTARSRLNGRHASFWQIMRYSKVLRRRPHVHPDRFLQAHVDGRPRSRPSHRGRGV